MADLNLARRDTTARSARPAWPSADVCVLRRPRCRALRHQVDTDRSVVRAVPLGTTVRRRDRPGCSRSRCLPRAGLRRPWEERQHGLLHRDQHRRRGVGCANTSARTILRASWRKLADLSSTRDYWGLDLAAVAEVTEREWLQRLRRRRSHRVQVHDPGAARVRGGGTDHRANAEVLDPDGVGGVGLGRRERSSARPSPTARQIGVTGAFRPAGNESGRSSSTTTAAATPATSPSTAESWPRWRSSRCRRERTAGFVLSLAQRRQRQHLQGGTRADAAPAGATTAAVLTSSLRRGLSREPAG